MDSDNTLVVFHGEKIRRKWFNDEWWFSVVDIVEALTEIGRARKYWSDLKKRLTEKGFELSAKTGQLKLVSADGKSGYEERNKSIFIKVESEEDMKIAFPL